MKCFTLSPLPGTKAALDVCLRGKQYEFVDHSRRPCVLICPGGGYRFLSSREAEPVAMAFVQAGFQACILTYSVRPTDGDPVLGDTPLHEAAAAVRCIRENADEWGIDPGKITVCGFSAGGHLAGSLGVFGSDSTRIPGAGDGKSQPNAMILCYPVISSGCKAHSDSFGNLSGHWEICPERDPWSLEKHVSSRTCPGFLWTTTDDDCVPAENSLLMAAALQEKKIPYELHMYAQGPHGLSVATAETGTADPHIATWVPLALQWLNQMGVGTGY